MIKYLLDTNTVMYTMKNRPQQVRAKFKQHQGQMAISTVTLGELIFGAEHSQQVERNLSDIEAMAARLEVLAFDSRAAHHFGQIRSALYKKGQPIGPYDMMIAGHARACGIVLVTSNLKEFERVPGLLVENWVQK
jgi:tRNA(fMet)-specific endonuclease VapC